MKIQSYNHQKRVHFNLIDLNLGTSPKSVAKKLKNYYFYRENVVLQIYHLLD